MHICGLFQTMNVRNIYFLMDLKVGFYLAVLITFGDYRTASFDAFG